MSCAVDPVQVVDLILCELCMRSLIIGVLCIEPVVQLVPYVLRI